MFWSINHKILSVSGRKDYWLKKEIMVYRYNILQLCDY